MNFIIFCVLIIACLFSLNNKTNAQNENFDNRHQIIVKPNDTSVLSFSSKLSYKKIRFTSEQKIGIEKLLKNESCSGYNNCCQKYNVTILKSFTDMILPNRTFEITCFDRNKCLVFVDYYSY